MALLLAAGPRDAQAQADAVPWPLLFTTMPPPAAFEPVAGERLEPQASVLVPLSSAVAVLAQLGVASTLDGRTLLRTSARLGW